MRLQQSTLPRLGWAITGAIFAGGALAFVTGLPPVVTLFALSGLIAPLIGLVLGVAFYRWATGKLDRLLLLSLLLAATASLLLLTLPVRVERSQATAATTAQTGRLADTTWVEERRSELQWPGLIRTAGPEIVTILLAPVAITGLPLAMYRVAKRSNRLGRWLVAGTVLFAALGLVAAIAFGLPSLLGLFYVPGAAALGAAAVSSWRRVRWDEAHHPAT